MHSRVAAGTSSYRGSLVFLMCLLTGACERAPTAPETFTLEVVSGSDQAAPAAAPLTQPIVVRVLGKAGTPVAGAEVHWRVIEGGGRINETTTLTDAQGLATVEWTLGSDVGQQLLLASSANASFTVRATAIFQVASVTAGFHHTCAVSTAGGAYCWGSNEEHQLGDNTNNNSAAPVRVATEIRFTTLTAGWSFTCGVSVSARAFCWGDNSVGQLGNPPGGEFGLPVPVLTNETFTSLSAGFVHTCGVTVSADLECWGNNGRGQLGGPQADRVRITGLQFRSVTTGEFHTCGLRADDTAMCWGWNSFGELGIDAAYGVVVATPKPVYGGTRFSRIDASVRHTCAVGIDGRVWCWGLDGSGETGQAQFSNFPVPVLVSGANGFSDVGIGNDFACGLAGVRAYCWGGLLGNGSQSKSRTPVLVSSTLDFSSLSVGYQHACGVVKGDVWCWGSNSHGQLGVAGINRSFSPVRVVVQRP